MSIDEAIRQSLQYMYNKTNGRGGLIMITNNGDIGKGFTTQRMVWASIDRNGLLQTGINEPKIAARHFYNQDSFWSPKSLLSSCPY